ncbi:hypothetical protein BDQ17DRAFT_1332576 [Cyathus striatus]|nr:hypothetical protein BDQ17DRAFT_1332576 [Cyathus striatus]
MIWIRVKYGGEERRDPTASASSHTLVLDPHSLRVPLPIRFQFRAITVKKRRSPLPPELYNPHPRQNAPLFGYFMTDNHIDATNSRRTTTGNEEIFSIMTTGQIQHQRYTREALVAPAETLAGNETKRRRIDKDGTDSGMRRSIAGIATCVLGDVGIESRAQHASHTPKAHSPYPPRSARYISVLPRTYEVFQVPYVLPYYRPLPPHPPLVGRQEDGVTLREGWWDGERDKAERQLLGSEHRINHHALLHPHNLVPALVSSYHDFPWNKSNTRLLGRADNNFQLVTSRSILGEDETQSVRAAGGELALGSAVNDKALGGFTRTFENRC